MDNQQQSNLPKRYLPGSDAEFYLHITRPSYADKALNPGLNDRVSNKFNVTDSDGNVVLDKKTGKPIEVKISKLDFYEIFTQDVRLGNLNDEEVFFCTEYLDTAYDCLSSELGGGALVIAERAYSVVEVSHSKKGWLRRILATLRMENIHEMYEPKKSFLGGNEKK